MTRWMGVSAALLCGGCATAMGQMSMPNPALSPDTTEATQSYETPPYRTDHHFEATLAKWTPDSLQFRLHFVNADACGLPSSYRLDLVDDRGHRYAFQPVGLEQSKKVPGHLGATLSDGEMTGTFPAKVDGGTQFVTLEIRPKDDRSCSPIDFRWSFAAPGAAAH